MYVHLSQLVTSAFLNKNDKWTEQHMMSELIKYGLENILIGINSITNIAVIFVTTAVL